MFELIARLEALEAATALYKIEDRVVVNAGTIHDPEYRVGTVVRVLKGNYYVQLDDDSLDKTTTPARGLIFKVGADHDRGGILGIWVNGAKAHKAPLTRAQVKKSIIPGAEYHGTGDRKSHRGEHGLKVGDRVVVDIGGRNNSLEPIYYLGTIASVRGDTAVVDFDEGHKTKFKAEIGTRGILGITTSEKVIPTELSLAQVKQLIKGFKPHDFGTPEAVTADKALKKGVYVVANFSHAQGGKVDDRYYVARVEAVNKAGYAKLRYMDNDTDVIAAVFSPKGILGILKPNASKQKAPISFSRLSSFLEDEYLPKPSEHIGEDKPVSNAKYFAQFDEGAKPVKPAEARKQARKPAARKPAARKPAARKPAGRKPAARKPAKKSITTKSSYSKGDRVMVMFDGGYIYLGTVEDEVRRGNKVKVLFDDGDDATYANTTVTLDGDVEGILGLTSVEDHADGIHPDKVLNYV